MSPQRDYYMTDKEIATAISSITEVADEVIRHSNRLSSTKGTAYQPRGLLSRLFYTKKYKTDFTGYAFGSAADDHSGIVTTIDGTLRIATLRQFPKHHRKFYTLLSPSEYVSTWLVGERFTTGDDTRQAIAQALDDLAQLLPEEHSLRCACIDENPVGEYAGSSLER